MPDARPDPAGRCPGASVRRRHGGRDARAEGRSEHVPVEGAQGADSPGGAPDTFLPPGASACFRLDGGVYTTRGGRPVTALHLAHACAAAAGGRCIAPPGLSAAVEAVGKVKKRLSLKGLCVKMSAHYSEAGRRWH